MPLTFIDIERQKSWRISILFLFLLFIYLIALAPLLGVFIHAYLPPRSSLPPLAAWGMLSLVAAGLHFGVSAYDTVNTVVRGLDAMPPDPEDAVHMMFMNILQEVHIVTGNKRTMKGMVIPSFSLNALAVADLQGNAVIAITEGLLSRLTRPQLEAVIAHEAHHILSNDCLETTIAASLFGTCSSAMEKLGHASGERTVRSPMHILGLSLLQLSFLLNMFVSREREYRADAASVRMTRNPIALAEALHLLSRSWRGAGFIGSGYEMLCIVNPQITALDETDGFWADVFSTHPPLAKRIDILLSMAHRNIAELEAPAEETAHGEIRVPASPLFYAMNPQQQWQGPFTLSELAGLSWLSPLTWITEGVGKLVHRAAQEPSVNAMIFARYSGQKQIVSTFSCPTCSQPLVRESYEGTQIHQCRFCSGILVDSVKLPRIIARTGKERSCSERISSRARSIINLNQLGHAYRKRSDDSPVRNLQHCPHCHNPMSRGFYSQVYLIEVDSCSFCGLTWFDKDELEMLQCLIRNRITPDVVALGPVR